MYSLLVLFGVMASVWGLGELLGSNGSDGDAEPTPDPEPPTEVTGLTILGASKSMNCLKVAMGTTRLMALVVPTR